MDNNDELRLIIRGFRFLSDVSIGHEFLKIFDTMPAWLFPQKITVGGKNYQPTNYDSITNLWIRAGQEYIKYRGIPGGGNFFNFKGKKPSLYYGNIYWDHNGYNDISIYISMKYIQSHHGYNDFLGLIKCIFKWCGGFYGFCHHPSQHWIHSTPGLSHEDCLGGISWLSFFGLPYVEMFGKDCLQTAPCRVEEFGENQFMLLTSEEPIEETPELLALQEQVRKHLGEDAFFRHEEEAKRPTTFTMEEVQAGKDLPNREGYRAPDFAKYYRKTPSSVMYDTPDNYKEVNTSIDILTWQQATAERAVEFAKDMAKEGLKVRLDYSEKSIQDIETILAALYESITPERKPTENQIQSAAVIWGAYLGEVLRRNFGGKWQSENDGAVLNIKNIQLFPENKVYKRLTNGPEDNIVFYFEALKAEILSSKDL